MTTPVSMGMIDHSGESTSVNFHLPAIEPDGDNWADLFDTGGAYDLLKIPLIAMTGCNLTRSVASIAVDTSAGSLPSGEFAQREWATRITYIDTVTNKKYRLDVPGPVAGLIPEGTDVIPLTNVLLAAFILVFEAQCVSPVGNPVQVIRAINVGRKS